jgi:hypothetical protein
LGSLQTGKRYFQRGWDSVGIAILLRRSWGGDVLRIEEDFSQGGSFPIRIQIRKRIKDETDKDTDKDNKDKSMGRSRDVDFLRLPRVGRKK